LFGGYDKAKFKGDLIAIPMQPDSRFSQVTTMMVVCTYFVFSDRPSVRYNNVHPRNFAEPAILDSGPSLTYFATDLFEQVAM